MRKTSLFVGLFIGFAIVIAFLLADNLKQTLAPKAFERLVTERFDNPVLPRLGDGTHVILVGTGSPQADPARVGPMTVIAHKGSLTVIDAGGGSVRQLGQFGLPAANIDRVLLTHLHSDHIDGLGELSLQRWVGGSHGTPLPLLGPDGVKDVASGLMQVYAKDSGFRTLHHGEAIAPPSGFGFAARQISAGVIVDENGLKITAVPVNHEPISPAFGYRIETTDGVVFITGDTAASPGLTQAAQGVDLLVSEALNPDMVGVIEKAARDAGLGNVAEIMSHIPSYHITPVEVAELARDGDVNVAVLTHLVPAVPNEALYSHFLKGTKEVWDKPLIVGEDGMVFTLRSGEISRSKL